MAAPMSAVRKPCRACCPCWACSSLLGLPVRGARLQRASGREFHVAGDSEVQFPVRAEGGRVVVDLYDGGVRADQPAVPHGPHVQRAAPADDQVGFLDQFGRQGRREASGHVERPWIAVEQAAGDGRGREQRAMLFGERRQGVPGTGRTRSPAGHEDRPPGPLQHPHERLHVGELRLHRGPFGRHDGEGRLVVWYIGYVEGLYSQREVEQHGPPLAHGSPNGIEGLRDGVLRRGHARRDRADRSRQRLLVDVEVGPRLGHLGRQHEQRRTALGRLGDAGHGVRQAGALMNAQRGHGSAHPGVRVCHGRRAALMARGHEPRTRRDHGIGEMEVARTDHAEDLTDPGRVQGPPDGLGDLHERSTRASTRAGDPDPVTIGSGPATTTQPVAGSTARFCNWVSPYLSLPMRYE